MEDFSQFVIILVAILFATLFLAKKGRDYRKYLARLTSHIADSRIGGIFGARLSGRYAEYEVRVEATVPSKNTPPHVLLKFFKPSSFIFSVSRQGTVTRLLKNVGFLKQITVGDPEFDQEYLLRAKDEMTARMIFSDGNVRDAIRAVFDAGYSHLYSRKGKLVAKKATTTGQMENDLRPEVVLPLLEALHVIAVRLP